MKQIWYGIGAMRESWKEFWRHSGRQRENETYYENQSYNYEHVIQLWKENSINDGQQCHQHLQN